MSTKKYLDDDGLLYVKQKLDTKFADKVDKVTGKGLSTEDYTTAEKTKLNGIEAGAEENVIETVKVNGTALTPDANKAVDVTVPTKTSDLTNDDNVVKDASYVHTDNNYTTTEKNKLSGIESGAEVNVIEEIEINGTAATISGKKATIEIEAGAIDSISVNGTPQTIDANKNVNITVPTNNNQLTNGAGYQTASDVETAINTKLATTYKPKGSVTFANLPALDASREGYVYDISNSFTTTADFVEGAGHTYPGGTNVVIINNGTEQNPSYKYDVLAGFIDLSGYVQESDLVAITNAEIDVIFSN